jgi:hypothetical protein
MDPQACLKRIVAAIEQSDGAEIADGAGDLLAWLSGKGFMPIIDRDSFCAILAELESLARRRYIEGR